MPPKKNNKSTRNPGRNPGPSYTKLKYNEFGNNSSPESVFFSLMTPPDLIAKVSYKLIEILVTVAPIDGGSSPAQYWKYFQIGLTDPTVFTGSTGHLNDCVILGKPMLLADKSIKFRLKSQFALQFVAPDIAQSRVCAVIMCRGRMQFGAEMTFAIQERPKFIEISPNPTALPGVHSTLGMRVQLADVAESIPPGGGSSSDVTWDPNNYDPDALSQSDWAEPYPSNDGQ